MRDGVHNAATAARPTVTPIAWRREIRTRLLPEKLANAVEYSADPPISGCGPVVAGPAKLAP